MKSRRVSTRRFWRDARRSPALLGVLVLALGIATAGSADTNPSTITINDKPLCGNFSVSSATGVTINDNTTASLYPKTLTVSGAAGTITDVNFGVIGFSHTNPDDVDILLVGPDGTTSVVVMSDAGGSTDASALNLSFNDQVSSSLPDAGPLAAGAFKPTDFEAGESFPAPAPASGYSAALSAFNGMSPNGTWRIYVVDDSAGETGSISGFGLGFTGSVPSPCNKEATPYPSTIDLTGLGGTVTDANVTLNGFSHTFPDDVDVLLVGPTGAKALVMSDVGGDPDAVGLAITLDDEAGSPLPDNTALSSGSFTPTDFEATGTTDGFPSPAPAGPYTTALSAFDSTSPSGLWSLYVADDVHGDAGSISDGWTLELELAGPTAVAVKGFHARPEARRVVLSWQTAAETEIAGFNLYRSSPGVRPQKLNRTLLPARYAGAARGAGYRFLDRRVQASVSYTYRLELVNLHGERMHAGAVALRARG